MCFIQFTYFQPRKFRARALTHQSHNQLNQATPVGLTGNSQAHKTKQQGFNGLNPPKWIIIQNVLLIGWQRRQGMPYAFNFICVVYL